MLCWAKYKTNEKRSSDYSPRNEQVKPQYGKMGTMESVEIIIFQMANQPKLPIYFNSMFLKKIKKKQRNKKSDNTTCSLRWEFCFFP